MIQQAYITAWRAVAPWQDDAQVEQDLVLSRAVVAIFQQPDLAKQVALRGGPFAIPAGPLVLRPEVVIRAGITSGGFTRLLGIGLALDAVGAQALECRWHLDASAPYLASITRDTTGEQFNHLLMRYGLERWTVGGKRRHKRRPYPAIPGTKKPL